MKNLKSIHASNYQMSLDDTFMGYLIKYFGKAGPIIGGLIAILVAAIVGFVYVIDMFGIMLLIAVLMVIYAICIYRSK